ncbi:MAG: cysteine hydrolase, partial [Firmicutes bacterium]|nr:cysteine hydrolase [Bacillota bacterium]
MLKDFVDPDGALYCGEAARGIVPFVVEKVREFDRAGDQVIFIMDAHDPEDKEFTRFPRHCVRGTPGAELVAELAALEGGLTAAIRVPKTRYSGFYGTDLERILRALA